MSYQKGYMEVVQKAAESTSRQKTAGILQNLKNVPTAMGEAFTGVAKAPFTGEAPAALGKMMGGTTITGGALGAGYDYYDDGSVGVGPALTGAALGASVVPGTIAARSGISEYKFNKALSKMQKQMSDDLQKAIPQQNKYLKGKHSYRQTKNQGKIRGIKGGFLGRRSQMTDKMEDYFPKNTEVDPARRKFDFDDGDLGPYSPTQQTNARTRAARDIADERNLELKETMTMGVPKTRDLLRARKRKVEPRIKRDVVNTYNQKATGRVGPNFADKDLQNMPSLNKTIKLDQQ